MQRQVLVCDRHVETIAKGYLFSKEGFEYICEDCENGRDLRFIFPVETIELFKQLNYDQEALRERLKIHHDCSSFLEKVRARKDKIAEEARELEKFVKKYQSRMTEHSSLLSGLMNRLTSQITQMTTTADKINDNVTKIVDEISDKIKHSANLRDLETEFTRPPQIKKMMTAAMMIKEAVDGFPLNEDTYLEHMKRTLDGAVGPEVVELDHENLFKVRKEGYEGYMNNVRQRDGFGVQNYREDGSTYEGEWVKDKRHGKGRLSWPDGSYYDGDWQNNLQEGLGKFHHCSGDEYIGCWKSGKKHGLGAYQFKIGGMYIGNYVNNLATGRGALFWNDGAMYVGDLKENQLSGRGLLSWPDDFSLLATFEGGQVANVVSPMAA